MLLLVNLEEGSTLCYTDCIWDLTRRSLSLSPSQVEMFLVLAEGLGTNTAQLWHLVSSSISQIWARDNPLPQLIVGTPGTQEVGQEGNVSAKSR